MGKNKQRTKNNARPSNSSRSAELLGTATPNFIGISAVKDGGYVPVLPGLSLCAVNELEMNNVDANFQVVLKKMNKKDSTTKWKALQEFASMCQDSELSAVEGMLPFWPRLYCALAIDAEHRVREAAQIAHSAVVKRVGKEIAMYLKQVAGAWFTSQHDTYPPAASAASNSFNQTFPERKIVDAIVHCQREILIYISDNITVHTAQSLSLQKSLMAEEMEVKYQKVLIASLQSYSFYLKKVPAQEIEKMVEIHKKIVSSARFWKLVKHDAVPIKTAFFNVLTSLIQNADTLLQDEKKRTVTAIMNSLDETEPGLLCAVWESMLVAINKIEDWHRVVNIEKLVLPKLWRVLRSIGPSCASIVYPNLLPFISQFPKLNVDGPQLYVNFFDNMRKGFSVKDVQISRLKAMAMITSFVECFRYSILLNVSDCKLCITLLKEQLMPVLEMCLKEDTHMKQICFCEMTHLLRYWSKNRDSETETYSQLIKEFWNELDILFGSLFDESQDLFDPVDLLLHLENAPAHSRKNLKVTFSNTDYSPESRSDPKNMDADTDTDTDTVFLSELHSLISSLCVSYFNGIKKQQTKKYLPHLNKLIKSFGNEEVTIALSTSLQAEIDLNEFYNEILRNCLQEKSNETEDIVELIFNLIKYMTNRQKDNVLQSLSSFDEIRITKTVVKCILSTNNWNDAVVKKWYSKSKLTSLVIDVVKEIASGNDTQFEENQDLILLIFRSSNDEDFLIEQDSVLEIVSILCDSFDRANETYMMDCAKLISHIAPLMWIDRQFASGAVKMIEIVFKVLSQEYFSTNLSFTRTICDVWKEGLSEGIQKLSTSEFLDLTKQFSKIIWKEIDSSNEPNVLVKSVLVDMAADFLEVIIDNAKDREVDYANEIIVNFLMEYEVEALTTSEKTIMEILGELLSSGSFRPVFIPSYEPAYFLNDVTSRVIQNIGSYLKWAVFNINVFNNLCSRLDDDSHVISIPAVIDLLGSAEFLICTGQSYCDNFKSTKNYVKVKKLFTELLNSFNNLYDTSAALRSNEYLKKLNIMPEKRQSSILWPCNVLCTPFKNLMGLSWINNEIITFNSETEPSIDEDIFAAVKARRILATGETSDCSSYSEILGKIILYERDNTSRLLLDCNISGVQWKNWQLTEQVLMLLTDLVKTVPTQLTQEHWTFLLISLVFWQSSIIKTKEETDIIDFRLGLLTVHVCELYHAVQKLMYTHESEETAGLPTTLLDEWSNVFVVDVQRGILKIWMSYAEKFDQKLTDVRIVLFLDALGKTVKLLDGKVLFEEPPNKGSSIIAIDLDQTIKLSLKLLKSPVPSIQLAAYHVMIHVLSELVERDKVLAESDNFDPNSLNIKRMEGVLQDTQAIVNTILMDLKLCDSVSCAIEPYTDSYTYTLAYLFVWSIILEMCKRAYGDLRYQYIEILKDNYFPCLLNNIFRLMPVEVLQDNYHKGGKFMEIFSSPPSLEFGESWTESRLDHIVCWTYTNSLRYLPVLVRQWWSTVDSRVSTAVDKITTRYISPMLCGEELLNKKLGNAENMQIKVHPTAREIVALYEMDNTKLELSIVLPPNHPLGAVTVEPGQYAGATANWRNCHMQLSICLTHQNGSVWDGIALWKRNLDKKFAGVEECYICFSIFHISTYQIPKLNCHTCRKKFHTPCLYKWFNTSQKSTCPVCRNVF